MHLLNLSILVLFASVQAVTIATLPARELDKRDNSSSYKINVHRKVVGDSSPIEGFQSTVTPDSVQWNTKVSIGAQTFTLLVDTGSSDLWVFSTDLPASEQGDHHLYDPSASTTAAVMAGEKFHIDYSVPGASGYVATDDVNIGGAVVNKMPVGVATKIGPYFTGRSEDGIIGLGFKYGNSIRPDKKPTFMESLQGSLGSPVMACNFRMKASGTLEFGAVDSSQFKGPLTTLPVINQTDGSWTVDNVFFRIGNTAVAESMTFDTGGVWMAVDPSLAAVYWAQVPGATNRSSNDTVTSYFYPCNSTLPDLTFVVGGTNTTIPGLYFHGDVFLDGAPLCTRGLQTQVSRGSMGSPFFASQYVVFNQADPSVSFAPHV